MATLTNRVEALEEKVNTLDDDMQKVLGNVNEVFAIAEKIWKVVKWGTPSIISAMVAAGLMSERAAIFFNSLFG